MILLKAITITEHVNLMFEKNWQNVEQKNIDMDIWTHKMCFMNKIIENAKIIELKCIVNVIVNIGSQKYFDR